MHRTHSKRSNEIEEIQKKKNTVKSLSEKNQRQTSSDSENGQKQHNRGNRDKSTTKK